MKWLVLILMFGMVTCALAEGPQRDFASVVPRQRIALDREAELAVREAWRRAGTAGEHVQVVFGCNFERDAASDARVRVCSALLVRPEPR